MDVGLRKKLKLTIVIARMRATGLGDSCPCSDCKGLFDVISKSGIKVQIYHTDKNGQLTEYQWKSFIHRRSIVCET